MVSITTAHRYFGTVLALWLLIQMRAVRGASKKQACQGNKPLCSCQSKESTWTVDCSNRDLDTLPKFPPKTISLNLDYNPLTTISRKDFAGLNELKTLTLNGVALTCNCDEKNFLKWLNEKNIDVGDAQCSNFDKKPRLMTLSPDGPEFNAECPNDKLTTEKPACDRSMCKCTNKLHNVTCEHLSLSSLPNAVPTQVRYLSLASNDFTSFPQLSIYKELKWIDLSDNKITGIQPGTFTNMKRLEELNLANNKIANLGEVTFAGLDKLTRLDLTENKIVSVNTGHFIELKKLKILILKGNEIRTITRRAFASPSLLEEIDLTKNPLRCACSEKNFRRWTEAKKIAVVGAVCSNLRDNPPLNNVQLAAFGDCKDDFLSETGKGVCIVCEASNVLSGEECDRQGKKTNCDAESCKTELSYKKDGSWKVKKSCPTSCHSQNQPGECVNIGTLDGKEGTCASCCPVTSTTVPCNAGESQYIRSYIHTETYTARIELLKPNPPASLAQQIRNSIKKFQQVPVKLKDVKILKTHVVLKGEVGFLVGYGPKMEQKLRTAITEELLGPEGNQLLSKWMNPDKVEIWPSNYCPPEQTSDELKGSYSWPATKPNAAASVECEKGPQKRAMRKCQKDDSDEDEESPQWADPDLSDCSYLSETTDKLDKLKERPITSETVTTVSKELTDLSVSANTTSDVALSTDVLDNIIESDAAYTKDNQDNTTNDAVTTISNLLNVDYKTMQGAGSARRLIAGIEAMIKKIKLAPGQEIGIVDDNMALTVLDTTTGKADNGLKYGVSADPRSPKFNKSNVGMGKGGPSTKTSVELPGGVFKNNDITKAAFVAYKTDMLFKIMDDSAAPSNVVGERKFKTTSNSMVLAASLDKPISGLTGSDKIGMKFQHRETELADNPRCAWWDEIAGDSNGTWSTKGCVVDKTDGDVTSCKCDHLTNFALLMDVYGSHSDMTSSHQEALTYISITGCVLSALGLLFTIFSYMFFHKKLLKDNPSKILMNLCFALLGLNLVFLGGSHYRVDDGACKAVAVLLHYFLIASFTWMGVEAFYMYLALVKVFQPYFSKLILKCSLVGWGLPLVVVIITIGVNKTDNYFLKAGQLCWIRTIPFYGAIVAPVGLILILNFVAFILVIRQLKRLAKRKKLTKSDNARTSTITQLRGAVSVVVLLGLTWLFAFLSIGEASLAFSYIFAILNTLQGLWIFIFYCLLKKDVQHAWMRKLICCPTPDDSRFSKDQLNDIDQIMNNPGKYTLNHPNGTKDSSGSAGSRKQSDSVTYIATYKRVSTDTARPLTLYTPAHLKSGGLEISPCGPFPSTGRSKKGRKDSRTSTNSTQLSSAASTKSKKSIASNATVMTNVSSENDTNSSDKAVDDNYNTCTFDNPMFNRSISEVTDHVAPLESSEEPPKSSEESPKIAEDEPKSAEEPPKYAEEQSKPAEQSPKSPESPSEPKPAEEVKDEAADVAPQVEEKTYKWDVKTPSGFVDSRGFNRPI